MLVTGAAGLLIGSGLFLYYGSDPKLPNLKKISDYQSAPDDAGARPQRRAHRVGGQPRAPPGGAPVGQIPKHFIDAVIAAEDPSFYQHEGIDYWAMLRSQVTNLLSGRIGPGRWGQGGSTITQQVIKPLVLSSGEDRRAARSRRSSWRAGCRGSCPRTRS